MRIAACLVTRGNVDLTEIIESIPSDWEIVVWDNSKREDLAVFGRYAAIALTDAEVIYVQDDDAVLDPLDILALSRAYQPDALTANMPARFRHDFYVEHCLVGFGAIFHRDLPSKAFDRFRKARGLTIPVELDQVSLRTCDVVFSGLTPRHLVDLPHRDLPWASDPDRMWKQPTHQAERSEMLKLVRAVRNG